MPALSTRVSYGLFTCFGRKAILRFCLSGAFGSAFLPLVAASPPLFDESFLVVPPHAAAPRASAATSATAAIGRFSISTPFSILGRGGGGPAGMSSRLAYAGHDPRREHRDDEKQARDDRLDLGRDVAEHEQV